MNTRSGWFVVEQPTEQGWLLAERWGRVGPGGIRVELPVTHEVIEAVLTLVPELIATSLRESKRRQALHDAPGRISARGRRGCPR